jgi:hypothetical protein
LNSFTGYKRPTNHFELEGKPYKILSSASDAVALDLAQPRFGLIERRGAVE